MGAWQTYTFIALVFLWSSRAFTSVDSERTAYVRKADITLIPVAVTPVKNIPQAASVNDSTKIIKNFNQPDEIENSRKKTAKIPVYAVPVQTALSDSINLANLVKPMSGGLKQFQIAPWDSTRNSSALLPFFIDSATYAAVLQTNKRDTGQNSASYVQVVHNPQTRIKRVDSLRVSAESAVAVKSPEVPVNGVSYFWPSLFWLFSCLAGIFCLLWATSRFLVFSVRIKPGPLESSGLSLATEFSAISPPLKATAGNNAQVSDYKELAHKETEPEKNHELELDSKSSENFDSRVFSLPGERYFFTELLLTAGPRKKYMSEPDADKDLGEDVCGLVTNSQQLLLWVLDGTSDQYCLRHPVSLREYFSSRLLAQAIANKLRLAFTEITHIPLEDLLSRAIQEVKADWLRQIAVLPKKEQTILRTNIANKNIPECATTLLFGTLNITGELLAYRSGDCKMVLYSCLPNGQLQLLTSTLASKKEESNDRLFFRLVLKPEGDFDIQYNTPRFEIVKQKQVHTLIAFSDGVGLETEARLQIPQPKSMGTIREEVIFQLQGTADDKAICFVEIRESKAPLSEAAIT